MISGFLSGQNITGGGSHSIIICSDGSAQSWGANYAGQLGNGSTTSSTAPVTVSALNGITSLASGWEHSLALKSDSTLWAWGANDYGQLGDSSTTDRLTPVPVLNLSGVVAVSTGHQHTHTLAAKSDGSAWAWGYNSTGKLGDNTTNSSNVPIQVHGPGNIGFLSGITSVSGGHDFSAGMKNDGTVWAWGANGFGQLGDSTTIQRLTPVKVKNLIGAVALASGDWHSMALKSDSTVWTWGYNGSGRLGDNTTISRNAAVQVHGPDDVGFLTGIIKIAAGENFCLALDKTGTVWVWGKNDLGQLGDNSNVDKHTPVKVSGPGGTGFLTGIVSISGGARHSMALKNDGTLWTWGDNGYGQLGDSSYTPSIYPILSGQVCTAVPEAIEEIFESPFSIFPNPSAGIINIEMYAGKLEIFNRIGVKVFVKSTAGSKKSFTADFSEYGKGLYLARILNNRGELISNKKFLIF